MSFSSEQKASIITATYKSCCRKSMIQGILFSKASLYDRIAISFEKRETADFVARLVKEFYGTISKIESPKQGGRRVVLSFDSKSAVEYISYSRKHNSELFTEKCDMCRTSFLRGVFLASGRISDPSVQYSLDFSTSDASERYADYLAEIDVKARVSNKKTGKIVYIKRCEDIEDFCAYAGLNKAMFTLIDAKANGELRKNVMRVANCETNNIAKAVDAARIQLEIISALDEAKLLSSLPEELETTARLRLRYADLSLSQLAAVSVPPISKPGLSHRLKKIIELGTVLLTNKNS